MSAFDKPIGAHLPPVVDERTIRTAGRRLFARVLRELADAHNVELASMVVFFGDCHTPGL